MPQIEALQGLRSWKHSDHCKWWSSLTFQKVNSKCCGSGTVSTMVLHETCGCLKLFTQPQRNGNLAPKKRTIGWKDPFIVAGTNICVSQYNITKHELSVGQSKVPNRCEAGLLFVRRKCLKGPWSYWTSRSWCSVVVDQEHQICTYTYHTISRYILVLTVY